MTAAMRAVVTPTALPNQTARLINLSACLGLWGAGAGAGRPGFCQNGIASVEQRVCTAGLPAPEGEVPRVAVIRPDHNGDAQGSASRLGFQLLLAAAAAAWRWRRHTLGSSHTRRHPCAAHPGSLLT
jgi:hypothetical protein